MAWLSLRLVHLALLASAASLFGYTGPARAQIPVQSAEAPAEPEMSAAPTAPPPVAAPALPAPPAPPASASTSPAAANALVPAKAERITEPDAHGVAETKAEDDQSYDDEDAERAHGSEWYGWQTLSADAPSLTAFFAGVSMSGRDRSSGNALAWFGILGYEFAPGIVHFVHRNPGRGFASFGLRLGMPLAGAFIGASLASGCNTNLCEASGAGAGILLGMAGAIAIDAAVLAYDDPKPSQAKRLLLVPLASLTPHQAWIGVGGAL